MKLLANLLQMDVNMLFAVKKAFEFQFCHVFKGFNKDLRTRCARITLFLSNTFLDYLFQESSSVMAILLMKNVS